MGPEGFFDRNFAYGAKNMNRDVTRDVRSLFSAFISVLGTKSKIRAPSACVKYRQLSEGIFFLIKAYSPRGVLQVVLTCMVGIAGKITVCAGGGYG